MSVPHSRALLACALVLTACGDDDGATPEIADSTAQAADALMRSLSFNGAEVRPGSLPDSTNTVTLGLAAQLAALEPGGASILPLEIDNPIAADNPEEAVLLQFEGVGDHLAVPASSGVEGAGDLNLDFSIDDDVCDQLCAKRFEVDMLCAVELEDGEVSGRWTVNLVLDCRERGDPQRCPGGEPPDDEPEVDAGGGQTPLDPGDAGMSGIDLPDSGIDPIDPVDPADAGIVRPPQAYLCADGSEEPDAIPCDGSEDCADGSDELACNGFYCGNIDEMIEIDQVCDGVMDCADGFDEVVACVPCTDGDGMFSSYQICDGVAQCADGTDEQPMLCDPMYPCLDGSMIPIDQVCDGTEQCPDGSDEPMDACP